MGRRLRAALPGIPIFLSSEVLPEIREFERTSTTAICAYVGPILSSYLQRLKGAITSKGLQHHTLWDLEVGYLKLRKV